MSATNDRSSTMVRSVLTGLLACVVTFLVMESVARLTDSVRYDIQQAQAHRAGEEDWFIYSPDVGWTRKPDYDGVLAGGERRFDHAGYFAVDSAQVATAGRKVMFVGDSNTFGYGVRTDQSFVEVVEHLLPGVATINLGVNGYSSYQGVATVDHYLPVIKPDAVVVSFNYNDRRYAPTAKDVDGPEKFDRVYRASRLGEAQAFDAFCDVSVFCRMFRRGLRGAGLLPQSLDELNVESLMPRVDEQRYRDNLSQIAESAAHAGVPVVFVLLNDNPIEAYHLNTGIEDLDKGQTDLAVAHLTTAVQAGDVLSDLARIELAKAYRASGDRAAAAAIVQSKPLISLHGGRVVRRDLDYNAVMRDVAMKYGAPLVDAAAILDQEPQDYIDICHFNAAGHEKVAALIARELSAVLSRQQVTARRPDAGRRQSSSNSRS